MADPVLHIKDGYYFEVPKFLWRYRSLEEVPSFLRDAHPHASLADFQHELDGKLLIPQPLGSLKNLYTPASGFCISKFMVLVTLAAALLFLAFVRLKGKLTGGLVPKGRFWNFFESFLVFLRDEVARPAIDSHEEHHGSHESGPPKHDGDRFLPLLWTVFFFVLTCNLLGLIPYAGAPTASFSVTLALAAVTFLTSTIAGIYVQGPGWVWNNFVPHMDLPWYMWPLRLVIFPIEFLGFCIKHGVLAIRLLANMVAGHLVLLAFLGMIVEAANLSRMAWSTVTLISIVASTALSCL